MVAKITSGKSISGMLNYNEHKVAEGKAKCILASKFGAEPKDLNFRQKLRRLQHLAEANSRSKTNALHISLNFGPNEKLSDELVNTIASRYMELIGFGEQPYLVYRHLDAGHPHVHIATTNIQPGGKRIDIHNLGRNQSEAARKMIENEFGLVKAERNDQRRGEEIRPVTVSKLDYGKAETKRAITNIVNAVIRQYNFTSLAELNAALRQFNVVADRGAEQTRMFEKRGLVYQAMNEHGERVGVPVKASRIYGKPTLGRLEESFGKNAANRQFQRAMLKNTLDKFFRLYPNSGKDVFIAELKNEGIDAVFRQNSKGMTFGLTLIDHKNKSVFKGSDVAGHYSAGKILERLQTSVNHNSVPKPGGVKAHRENSEPSVFRPAETLIRVSPIDLAEILLAEKSFEEQVAKGLKRKKKKKTK